MAIKFFSQFLHTRTVTEQNDTRVHIGYRKITKPIHTEDNETQTFFDLEAVSKSIPAIDSIYAVKRQLDLTDVPLRTKNHPLSSDPGKETLVRRIVERRTQAEADVKLLFPRRIYVEWLTKRASYYAAQQRIRSFAQLPEGWDGNSAYPPGKLAIELALRFVGLLEKHGFRVEWTAPTVDDSIMVVLNTLSGRQEWEFYGDGDTAVLLQKTGGEKEYLDLKETEFEQILTR